MNHQDELQQRANEIRLLWINERRALEQRTTGTCTTWGDKYMPQWDGGVDKHGRNHESVWLKIVAFCELHQLQPETLITALFFRERLCPKPNQCHGPYALRKYKAYTEPGTRQELRQQLLHELESQKSYAAANKDRLCRYSGKTAEEAYSSIALDGTANLTVLFRYCLLRAVNHHYAEKFREQATRIFLRHADLYTDIWKEWIPDELKAATEGKENETARTTAQAATD